MTVASVRLPHGLYDEAGRCHRDAVLRPLTGAQEAALAGRLGAPGAYAATGVLASCVERLGDIAPDEATCAALTRGDRHVLLLALRRLLFGDRVALVLTCPSPACGEAADLVLRVSELVRDRAEPARPIHAFATDAGVVRVREPTGRDDAAIEAMGGDVPTRSAALWARLVVDVDGAPIDPAGWAALPAPARHAVAIGLAESWSVPDLAIVAPCPTCAALMELDLDPMALLARELHTSADRLAAEVHCIAFHYHWSEDAILALPRTRRWKYLDLLRRELEGRPLVDGWS